jgi:hypothetical protein
MIMEENLEFLDAGSAANEAGTTLLGDVIDLGAASRDIGNGHAMYLVIQVVTAADGGAGAGGLLSFSLCSDAAAAISTDGTQTIHFTTDVFTAAQLPAGKQMVFPLPMGDTQSGDAGYERYLGICGTQSVEGEDDLTLNAFLTLDPPGWKSYADGTN